MLDALAIAVILIFMVLGFVRGILHEGLILVALMISYFASARLEAPVGTLVLSLTGLAPGMAFTVGRVLGGVLIYTSLAIAVRMADKRIGRTRQGVVVPWNRNLGALVGFLVGAALSFCLLCLADAFYKASPEPEGGWAQAARDSFLRQLVSPVNPADRLLVTDALRLVRILKDDPEKIEELKQKDIVQKLGNTPAVQEILADAELMDAIHRQDVKRVATDRKIRELLKDAELRKLIFSQEMRAALREVARASEEAPPAEVSPGTQQGPQPAQP